MSDMVKEMPRIVDILLPHVDWTSVRREIEALGLVCDCAHCANGDADAAECTKPEVMQSEYPLAFYEAWYDGRVCPFWTPLISDE
jgi:hypothetical protein